MTTTTLTEYFIRFRGDLWAITRAESEESALRWFASRYPDMGPVPGKTTATPLSDWRNL